MAAPPAPDLLVTTGGVSVGRHDHLRPALEACGVREVLYGVEIRPGHAMRLGRRGPQLVLGLPGNPVSAAVCFHAGWSACKSTPARARSAAGARPHLPGGRPRPRPGGHPRGRAFRPFA
jgi:molybdopterin molybdotransferase